MEVTIIGLLYQVEGVQPVKNGFVQHVILHQEEVVDNRTGRVVWKEEFFKINIWSKEQTDSRFKSFGDKGQKMKALCRVRGERWLNQSQEFTYATKLNLKVWES
jgi:hypothetical protein